MIDTDADWEKFAQDDPYFSVLTQAEFAGISGDESAKARFFGSGAEHVGRLLGRLERLTDSSRDNWSVLDFGCGVGRTLVPFAKSCRHAVGVDVAPTMLEEARRNCAAASCDNVALYRTGALPDDSRFDLIHSYIVFQHIPVRRGMQLLQRLLTMLKPDGCVALHFSFARTFPHPLPGWKLASRFTFLIPFFRLLRGGNPFRRRMLMMRYELNEVLLMLYQAGFTRLQVDILDENGNLGAMLLGQRGDDVRSPADRLV